MAIGQVLMFPVRLITGVVSFGGSLFGVIGEESPAYKILAKVMRAGQPGFEIRRYGAFQVVSTPTSDENNGFMKLAGYIGVMGEAQNESQEKMSMTTPVISDLRENGAEKMSFSLPSSVEAPPRPTNADVATEQRPESTWAVHRSTGGWQKEQALEMARKLRQAVGEQNVDSRFPPEWYRFNPPWTLNWFRTNEVAIKLKDKRVNALVDEFGASGQA